VVLRGKGPPVRGGSELHREREKSEAIGVEVQVTRSHVKVYNPEGERECRGVKSEKRKRAKEAVRTNVPIGNSKGLDRVRRLIYETLARQCIYSYASWTISIK
jgi:hypothetical protein